MAILGTRTAGRRGIAVAALVAVAFLATAFEAAQAPPAEARTLPPGIQGVDVSNYQHAGGAAIDWHAVKASGREFAYVKATEGAYNGYAEYTNPYYRADFEGVRRRGAVSWCVPLRVSQLPLSTARLTRRGSSSGSPV